MDTAQISELRTWAEGLSRDDSSRELRAAGRAILLLLEEIDRLRRAAPPPPPPESSPDAPTDEPPAPAGGSRGARARASTRDATKRWRGLFRIAIAAAVLGALVFATFALGARLSAPSLDASGPSRNAGIGPALLPSLHFSVSGSPGVLDRVRWKLDGADVTNQAYDQNGRVVLDGTKLHDGPHRVQATVTGGFPGSRTTKTWRFTVDTTGPTIRFDPPGVLIPSGQPVRLAGTLEPGATLIADGRPVLVKDGRFHLSWKTRPTEPVMLVATDPLRNATTHRIWISMQPRRPPHPIRAVHVTFDGWYRSGDDSAT